jgi:predicted XRE-type DNA-binding protein
MKIMETIRKEIQKSPQSQYEIAKNNGLNKSIVCRIMQGKTCSASAADKLLTYFGYELKRKKGKVKP